MHGIVHMGPASGALHSEAVQLARTSSGAAPASRAWLAGCSFVYCAHDFAPPPAQSLLPQRAWRADACARARTQRNAGLRSIALGRHGATGSLSGSPALVTSSPGGRSSRSGAAGAEQSSHSQDTSFAAPPPVGGAPHTWSPNLYLTLPVPYPHAPAGALIKAG